MGTKYFCNIQFKNPAVGVRRDKIFATVFKTVLSTVKNFKLLFEEAISRIRK